MQNIFYLKKKKTAFNLSKQHHRLKSRRFGCAQITSEVRRAVTEEGGGAVVEESDVIGTEKERLCAPVTPHPERFKGR